MSQREDCAPVEIMSDHRQTVGCRTVVDLTETDQERLLRGLELLDRARELLGPLDREADWRLEARRAACSIWEEVES